MTLLIIIITAVVLRIGWQVRRSRQVNSASPSKPKKPISPWQKQLFTVGVFFVINLKRITRDRTALFFTFLFPLIFLFVFGSLSHSNSTTFNLAIINHSGSAFSKQFVSQINHQKIFKVNNTVTSINSANEKMTRGELDATIELPANFGNIKDGKYPSGQAVVDYTDNSQEAAQTLTSVLQAEFSTINSKFVKTVTPLTVTSKENNEHSLNSFDYTFTGLLGFAILGSGIFGPINVFPELKKMGILRRLHTTPLRVWQYFLSTMIGNAVIGLASLAVMLVVSILVFHLKVVGNYFELAIFLAFGIIEILGIGLALGGWAKNERQVAPLGNIIVFPMMFLSGVFFPRFLMPTWLQSITNYIPMTPIIDGARLIATEGKSIFSVGPQLLVMAVWTIIIYAIAFRVFRWE
jgi:ABC-2 type transport system permease protein